MLDVILSAMANAKDRETAEAILRRNLPLFPGHEGKLREAYASRFADLRSANASLDVDVWDSMALAAAVLGIKHNPESRNPQQMPEMVRKHGAAEAIRRVIGAKGANPFFRRCVDAGDLRYTGEAIALRHPQNFDQKTLATAEETLARYPGHKR
jgi:hypothetical protein